MGSTLDEQAEQAYHELSSSVAIDAKDYAKRHQMTTHEARVVFYRLVGIGLAKRVTGSKDTFTKRR